MVPVFWIHPNGDEHLSDFDNEAIASRFIAALQMVMGSGSIVDAAFSEGYRQLHTLNENPPIP